MFEELFFFFPSMRHIGRQEHRVKTVYPLFQNGGMMIAFNDKTFTCAEVNVF